MNNKINRIFFGALIGLLGGISFGITVFPAVTERFLADLPTEFYVRMATYMIPGAILWVPGGALTGWQGGARRGALIMGVAGLVAGTIYGFVIGGLTDGAFLGLSAVSSAIYSGGAGLLVGGAFPPAEEQ